MGYNKPSSLKLKTFSKEKSLKLKASNRANEVCGKADYLAKKFGDYDYVPFFRKCFWHLSEDTIWTIYERSHRQSKTSPIYYFIGACKKEMA